MSKSSTNIPFEKNQEKSKVYFKRWIGNQEQRIDLVFDTIDSHVSHSISLEQYKLLKKAISDFENRKD